MWGAAVGLLLLNPVAGAAVGAAAGAERNVCATPGSVTT